jgi:uncharacterized membrane protein YqjE
MATDEQPSIAGPASSLFESLRNLLASFLAIAQTRLELLTTEVQEEIERAALLLTWAFIALLAGLMGLLLGALTVVFAFWETHRILAGLCMTGLFVLVALIAVLFLLGKIRNKPRILDATLSELANDREQLRKKL